MSVMRHNNADNLRLINTMKLKPHRDGLVNFPIGYGFIKQ